MIDPTTLPIFPLGSTITVGQRFTIVGQNFSEWPSEVVLGISESAALENELPDYRLMRLIEKTNTMMVFEATGDHVFGGERTFSFFAAGFATPRALLEYNQE